MSKAERELHEKLAAAVRLRTFRKIDFFQPYPKQAEFYDMGALKDERLLMAGNQDGKSYAGAYEAALHATGLYPDWWLGRRWERPTKGWVCGESAVVVRDTPQKYLCGEPGIEEMFGSGFIPRELFIGAPSMSRGVTDAYDTIHVRHASGGVSILKFKSYEQGRKKLQSDTIDWAWCDEEPPQDIYSEIITRLTATHGIAFITFTPLQGMSDVVISFLDDNKRTAARGLVNMTIYDAKHITEAEREKRIAAWPEHEREARALGIPMLGSGRIFTVPESAIREPRIDPDDLPAHWALLWAIDFGIDHPFAAVLLAWDRDNDVLHILGGFRIADKLPRDHAAIMKAIAVNVPVAWPQDGTARQTDGKALSEHYRREGLKMLASHATWPDGGYDTEAGVMEMADRFSTSRLMVTEDLPEWFEEYRLYHRKDGLIVKIRDDLLSATRVGVMMKRFARAMPLGSRKAKPRGGAIAQGVDFDVHG